MSLGSVMVTVKRIAGIVLQWATAYAALIVLAATNLSVRKFTSPMCARGAFHFQTNSDKLSRLNSLAGVFEYDIDPDGNSKGKIWEWA